jgi:hypothetical protein
LKNEATAGLFDLVHKATKSSLLSSINLCRSLSELLSLFKSTHIQGTRSDFIFRVKLDELFIISSNTRASSLLYISISLSFNFTANGLSAKTHFFKSSGVKYTTLLLSKYLFQTISLATSQCGSITITELL